MSYNAAITPWFNAALDLQIIDQAIERTLNSSGSGLRDVDTASRGRAAPLLVLLTAEQ